MKCTPEEAHELAGKVGRAFAEDANMLNLALLIDRAREPLQAKIDALMLEHCSEEMTPKQIAEWAKHQRPINAAARLEVLEREHTEFFDRWHDERRKREALELERDALAEQVAKIRAEAMEEAAALCESKIERPAGFGGRFEGYGKFMDSLSGDECAALIRARIPG